MKRSELVAHCQQNLGSRSDSNALTTAELVDYLNFALEDLASIRNWRPMRKYDEGSMTIKEGFKYYALPSDVKDPLLLKHFDNSSEVLSYPMVYKPPETFDAQFPNPDAYGEYRPHFWTWRGGDRIEVYPVPNSTGDKFHLFYAAWPDKFDTTADLENPLTRLDHALISMATVYGFESKRDFESAAMFERRTLKKIKRMGRAEREPSAWTPQYGSQRMQNYIREGAFDVPTLAAGTTQSWGL